MRRRTHVAKDLSDLALSVWDIPLGGHPSNSGRDGVADLSCDVRLAGKACTRAPGPYGISEPCIACAKLSHLLSSVLFSLDSLWE